MCDLSTDTYGSHVVRQIMEYLPYEQKAPLLEELFPEAPNLALDRYGSYVIETLFEKSNLEEKKLLGHKFKGEILYLSMHEHGQRVVRKALTTLPSNLHQEIFKELQDNILKCCEDQYGSLVIRTFIESSNPRDLGPIFNAIKGKVRSSPYLRFLKSITTD